MSFSEYPAVIAVFCLCYLSFPDVIVHIVSKLSFYIFQFCSAPHAVCGFFLDSSPSVNFVVFVVILI